MFSFDRLLTPKIISGLYIITVVFLVGAAGIGFISQGFNTYSILLLVLALFSRIFFECIMVSFKNNEYLRRIAAALETK
ncbi:hypothetical protein PSNIH1_00525 [Pantoea sp. PSNIH1]|nr:hypothetical protein PSNIH1_00525 [Pantoea sp. PSNIH1]